MKLNKDGSLEIKVVLTLKISIAVGLIPLCAFKVGAGAMMP